MKHFRFTFWSFFFPEKKTKTEPQHWQKDLDVSVANHTIPTSNELRIFFPKKKRKIDLLSLP